MKKECKNKKTSEASLQPFLHKLKQKNFFNEIEYYKFYPSGSVLARVYGTLKMHKFSSGDSFPKLRRIVSSIGTFNYNPACFLFDFLSPLVPMTTLANIRFPFFLKLIRMQIFPENFLFPTL